MQRKSKNKIIIGITGSYGSGKSTVARILKEKGAVILDADKIAHECIRKNKVAYDKLLRVFGKEILDNNRNIGRKKLGMKVFNNQALLRKLNKIVHPEVIRIIKASIKRKKGGVIILDAPLLLEAGLKKDVDKLIVVNISRNKQIARLIKKTSLNKHEILKRINSQIPLRKKIKLADFIIDNNGTVASLNKQTKSLWISLVRLLRTRDQIALLN